jgi:GT2 family glycosyltransferase/glycosyltransferase involved in cell wall biosynthesis
MQASAQKPLISVVIPSYNRAELLKTSLKSLIHQSIPHTQYEVIVIDDGSTDHTGEVCRHFELQLPLIYRRLQTNSGISAAKNLGIFIARADIIFFFDDDDMADRNLLAEHIKSHREHPEEHVAILGYTTWGDNVRITQVMNYIMRIGQFLFSYESLKHGQSLDFTYFWGGRSSCKRSFLVKHGVFNSIFHFILEDIELGYRLSKFGLQVFFNKNAVSYMVRPITFEQFCRRCEREGHARYLFSRLHADLIIQQYCRSANIEEYWEFITKIFDTKMSRILEIEQTIDSVSSNDKQAIERAQALLPELGNLYWWAFHAHRMKGFMAEKDAIMKPVNDRTHQPVKLRAAEVEEFNRRWPIASSDKRLKKNILVIDNTLPWFDRAAGSLRMLHILRSLKELGYFVTFIARNGSYADMYVPMLHQMGIEVYPGDPVAMDVAGSYDFGSFVDVEKILGTRSYDDVILSFWDVAEYYLPLIRKYSPQSRIIVDTVDIHFVREIREAELNRDTRAKEAALARKERELSIYQKADMVWVVTRQDKEIIRKYLGTIPIEDVPTIHATVDGKKQYSETSDLIFIGNFNHRPNRDAVMYFCREVFPKILHELPEVKLYIVGNNPSKEVQALAAPNVIVTGYVADVSRYLKNARVSVSPLRYGSGMKGKIGEALSWGLPVVTTSIGAEGMDLKHGDDALIADTAMSFAGEVVRVYKDQVLWQHLAECGIRKVTENWSPEVIRKRLASILTLNNTQQGALTSIVILTYNGLEFTKQCLSSIKKYTKYPHEVIIVDNASTDGTCEYLQEWKTFDPNYHIILNDKNRGFPAGNNQGIIDAKGDYLVFLNNDVVVTENWLEGLIECAESDPTVGIVGPMTNYISGPQMEKTVGYKKIDDLQLYAGRYRNSNRRKWLYYPRITGFCMLVKRQVVDTIGGFDPLFGKGNYEDDDFCLRTIIAGYKNVIAGDVFVHHYGGKSFRREGENKYIAQLKSNENVFTLKWATAPEQIWQKQEVPQIGKRNISLDAVGAEEAYTLGHCAFTRSDFAGALEYFMIAEGLLEFSWTADVSLFDLQLRKGDCYFKMEQLQEAKEQYEKALHLDADSPEACYNIGLCYEFADMHDAAIKMFECAVALKPDWTKAREKIDMLRNLAVQIHEISEAI